VVVCKFFNIVHYASAYEIDPRVSVLALIPSLTPMTRDWDVLAYRKAMPRNEWEDEREDCTGPLGKIILVKTFNLEWYCNIDLEATAVEGEYLMFDLYQNHGQIVFSALCWLQRI